MGLNVWAVEYGYIDDMCGGTARIFSSFEKAHWFREERERQAEEDGDTFIYWSVNRYVVDDDAPYE